MASLGRLRFRLVVIAFLAGMLAAARPAAAAFQLITPAEAALPQGTISTLALRGSPTRRPHITVVFPPPNGGTVHSPLDLIVRFKAFGGAKIDSSTVVLTYLKQPAIDLTQRIEPFITAAGFTVPQAQVPPGLHRFWIELKDKDGRIGEIEFSFQVAK